ncbi:MAG TPA: glucose-6-phosphate dehydrogenase assembly protein OpcA [Candidatus Tumulicola sp.]
MSADVRTVLAELENRRQSRKEDAANVALMTLVAFFEDERIGAWLRERLHSLAVKDPARVIVLDATKPATFWCIGLECGEHSECLKTRGEWIELGVRAGDPETLQSVVAALALPQAPIVLVWGSTRIAQDARFARLAPSVGMVVYNSSALDDGDGGLRQLAAFVHANPEVAMCDLAYLRLAPWQECIALFFDGKNVIRELFDLRRVEIAGGSAAEAYYLLGWLASRLEWTACAADRFCNRFGTEIEFEVALDGPPRRIRRVALHSTQTRFVAELGREEAAVIALTVTGAAAHPDRYHPITNVDTSSLIERAILGARQDRIFFDSLLAAGDVLSHAQTVRP